MEQMSIINLDSSYKKNFAFGVINDKIKEEVIQMAKGKGKSEQNVAQMTNDVARMYQAYMRRSAISMGLLASYRPLLSYLAQHDGANQLSMVRITGFRPPTISVTLRRMEEEGLVTREASKQDARAVLVHLTEKGKKCEALLRKKSNAADAVLTAGIAEEEMNVFKKVLLQMRENAESEGWCVGCEDAD